MLDVAAVRAAVGFSIHTGWAAAVVMAGPPPRVLDRRRIELAERNARFVFHVAAEHPDQAEQLIAQAEKIGRERVVRELRTLGEELPEYDLVVALPPSKRPLPPVPAVLKSHPLLHAAEGELFRRVIAEGAEKLGIPVKIPQRAPLPEVGKMGPPWGKDQKDAAALAYALLSR